MTEIMPPQETYILYERSGVEGTYGSIVSMTEYFSYDYIPVEPGKTYSMPWCRNTALLDEQGNVIRIIGGSTMETNGYLLTIPEGIVYLRTCARYDAISVEEFSITEVTP